MCDNRHTANDVLTSGSAAAGRGRVSSIPEGRISKKLSRGLASPSDKGRGRFSDMLDFGGMGGLVDLGVWTAERDLPRFPRFVGIVSVGKGVDNSCGLHHMNSWESTSIRGVRNADTMYII